MNAAGEWMFAAVIAPYLAALVVILIHRAKWYAIAWTGVAGIAVSAIASVLAFISASHGATEGFKAAWVPSLGVEFSLRTDFLSLVMGIVVSWLSLLIAIYSVEYVGAWNSVWYWFFFTFFVGSMQLLVYADDLFALLVGWEGTGLASYALISFYYDDRKSDWVGDPGRRALGVPMWSPPTHSGIRAIVFTRLADGGTLIGIGLIHAVLGTTSMAVLEHLVPSVIGYTIEKGILIPFIVAFYLGALAKSAQFPFHEWLVTAMTGPAPVSALIHAATMVKAGIYFALRFTPWIVMGAATVGVLAETGLVYNWFLWIALLTAFATASMAIVARELKLIWAYSTASQLSYMFAAVFGAAVGASAYALAGPSTSIVGEVLGGVFGGLSHLISHAVFKAALFLTAGALIHAVHSRYITDMGGLRKSMPYTFIAALLAGLSLAAIPPFSGWWSKDSVIASISAAGPWATTAALITAVLTAFYTIRALVYIFSTKPTGREAHGHEPGWLMRGPYLFLGLTSIALGLIWPFLMEPGVAEGLGYHPERTSLTLMVTGTAAALVGAGIAGLYLAGWKPWRTIEASSVLRGLHTFLYDRWFVNALIYRLIVYPVERLAFLLRDYMEYAIDTTYHVIIPASVRGLGGGVRSVHNGDLSRYFGLLILGLIVSVLIAYYVVLAYAIAG
ncbi:MAG: NADH-quinone oxidoreductase subunit L [Pyrodictiaceae archaeon]